MDEVNGLRRAWSIQRGNGAEGLQGGKEERLTGGSGKYKGVAGKKECKKNEVSSGSLILVELLQYSYCSSTVVKILLICCLLDFPFFHSLSH